MQVKSVEKEKNSAKVVVEIEKELFESGLNSAYLANRGRITIPGFRKGKAPRKIIEAMYGKEVFYEDAIEEIFPRVYQDAVIDQGLKAVGAPSIADLDVSDEGVLTLTIQTDLYPEVTLGQYKGLEIPREEPVVTDEEVEAEINRMAKNIARIETVEREAQEGDTAVIDFEGFRDGVAFEGGKGEDYELVLGSGTFIPGFEEQVIGMKAGQEADISVRFPDDYQEESLAGAAVTFHVVCHSVKQTILPELDDEFAKDVSEFDTLQELREDLKKKALEKKSEAIARDFENAAVDKAVENMQADIPQSMIDEAIDRELRSFEYEIDQQGGSIDQYIKMLGTDWKTFRSFFQPSALRNLKSSILLDAVAEAESIKASEEEIEEEFKKLAESYQMELEKIKEIYEPKDVEGDIAVRKAARLIADSAIAVAPVVEAAQEKASEE